MSRNSHRAPRAARSTLHAIMLAALVSSAARAQQSCSIEETKPKEIRDAFILLQRIGPDRARAATDLKSAVKLLTENGDRIKNAPGRSLELARALSLWMQQPGIGFNTTAGQIGYAGNPQQPIDLIAATDSLLREVAKVPGCEKLAETVRQQTPWATEANAAIEQFNAGHADSAVALATLANRLWAGQPYGALVLGNVAQQRGQTDEALRQFDQSQRSALADTSFAETRRKVLLAMANVAANAADSATGARRDSMNMRANQTYDIVINTYGTSPEATSARGIVSRRKAMSLTAAEVGKNASAYSYEDLILAGVRAARASQFADAAALFEHALELNPYSRDALYNGALMYIDLGQFDRAIPMIRRLMAVDPSSADDYLLMANAYNGIAKAKAKTPAAKPATDSTLKYYTLSEQIPATLTVQGWTNSEGTNSVTGTVQNRGTAAKAYTITFEFLDKSGAVLGTQTTTTAVLAPKTSAPFKITYTGPNVIGYRYKAI
jgi:tetratricopeptide (TPR) repeat protein